MTLMKNLFRIAPLAACLCAATLSAQAAGISLLAPVAIDPKLVIPSRIQDKCRLDDQLKDDILAGLKRYDSNPATTTDPASGQVLRVVITDVYGLGGGAFTGRKSMAVRVDYLSDGKIAYTARVHRLSGLGSGFQGTCSLLEATSKGMGRWISKWAQNPRNVAEDASGSTGASAASEPASDAEN